jgi:hypothetical protein
VRSNRANVSARLRSTVRAPLRGEVSPRLRASVPAGVARRIPAHVQRISIADRRGVRRDPAAGASSSHRDPLPSCALVMVRVADCRATRRAAICPDGMAIARCPAMQNLRILACVVAALGSLTAAGCGSDNDNDCDNGNNGNNGNNGSNGDCAAGALRVQNQSSFAITEIHVTSVGSTTWGPNLISGTILAPDASLTVAVSCDQYDALLIDQAGAQCIIHNVDLCFSTADWIIKNDTCSAFTSKPAVPTDPGSGSGAAH